VRRMLLAGLVLLVCAGALGCDEALRREWTVKASVVEAALIANSECWPDDIERMTAAQAEAFGTARVALYEKYGQAVKDGLEALK